MTTPPPPGPLPPDVRAMLAAYRSAHELPAAARERIWAVVGADDAPAPAFDPMEDAAAARGGASERPRGTRRTATPAATMHRDDVHSADARVPSTRWLAWGTVTLAAAAALVLAWQLGGTLAVRRHATSTPDAAVMQSGDERPRGHASPRATGRAASPEADSAHGAASTSPAPTLDPAAGSSPATDPSPATATRPAETATRPRSPQRDTAERDTDERDGAEHEAFPPTDAAGSSLAAERELVARAWRALALGETGQALEAADEHARRFPAGLLAPERAAIDTIARCRRGDADGDRRRAAFHRAHPRSPLAARVDEACATTASKDSPTP